MFWLTYLLTYYLLTNTQSGQLLVKFDDYKRIVWHGRIQRGSPWGLRTPVRKLKNLSKLETGEKENNTHVVLTFAVLALATETLEPPIINGYACSLTHFSCLFRLCPAIYLKFEIRQMKASDFNGQWVRGWMTIMMMMMMMKGRV